MKIDALHSIRLYYLKIGKLNLEIKLFTSELQTYIQNVNVIDEKTEELLLDLTTSTEKLISESKLRKSSSSSGSNFLDNFGAEHLECRREIFCRLCEVNFKVKTTIGVYFDFSTKQLISAFSLSLYLQNSHHFS